MILAGAVLGAAAPAFAQSQDESRVSVAGSYAYLREQGVGGAPAVMYKAGWIADLDWRLHGRLAVVGEVGGSYRGVQGVETQSLYGFLGGVRVAILHLGPAQVFGQGLVGLERFSEPGFSEHGLAIQPGAGADIGLGHRVALRAQVDFRLAHEEGVNFKEIRAAAGIVWRVGTTGR